MWSTPPPRLPIPSWRLRRKFSAMTMTISRPTGTGFRPVFWISSRPVSFQDITGQRISKVVEHLAAVEKRLSRFCLGGECAGHGRPAPEPEEQVRQTRKEVFMLHGPSSDGDGVKPERHRRAFRLSRTAFSAGGCAHPATPSAGLATTCRDRQTGRMPFPPKARRSPQSPASSLMTSRPEDGASANSGHSDRGSARRSECPACGNRSPRSRDAPEADAAQRHHRAADLGQEDLPIRLCIPTGP